MDAVIGLLMLAGVVWFVSSVVAAVRQATGVPPGNGPAGPRGAHGDAPIDPMEAERREAGAYFDGLIIGGLWLGGGRGSSTADGGSDGAFLDSDEAWHDDGGDTGFGDDWDA